MTIVLVLGFISNNINVYAEEVSGDVVDITEAKDDVGVTDSQTTSVSCIAIEEERKGKEYLAKVEQEEEEFKALVSRYFSEDDVVMLAQLIDIEANSVYPLRNRAAVGWTVVNRVDNGRWGPTTISGIITQPGQYAWYAGRSYSQTNYDIALDVLTRWATEQIEGAPNFGRVLPPNYDCFYGDGVQNHFYDEDGNYWDFSVVNDPYEHWE